MASLLRCLVVPPDTGSWCPGRYCTAGQRCLCLGPRLLSRCCLCVPLLSLSHSLFFSPSLSPPPIYVFFFCLFKYLHDGATLVSDIPGLMARGMSVCRQKCCSRCAPAAGTGSNFSFPIVWVSKSSCVDGRIQIICFKDFSNIFWMWCERREVQSHHGNSLSCHAADPTLRTLTEDFKSAQFYYQSLNWK